MKSDREMTLIDWALLILLVLFVMWVRP